jgi:hypothetical protein
MAKLRKDAPIARVIAALEKLVLVRTKQHVSMERPNADGSTTPLTMPNHRTIKSSTLRTIRNQSGISRQDFLKAFDAS